MEMCAEYTWWHIALGALMIGAVSVSLVDIGFTIRRQVRRWWKGTETYDD